MKSESFGTLYGIGVGPGDPELLTIKSVNYIKSADVIFTASSSKNSYSLAVEIAKPYVPENADVRIQSFPMTTDIEVAEKAWADNSDEILEELSKGKNVAFLTLGDPLTYSTFGYILKHIKIKTPELNIVSSPGITSYQAAASRTNTILVEGEESLLITSGAMGGETLRKSDPENVVFLKAYKNIKDINKALEEKDMTKGSIAVSRCGRKDEQIIRDIDELTERDPDYWTLIVAKKEKQDVR